MKRTKIICTLGPSSNTEEVVRELINNGMNVARFNFSHADHEEHLGRISIVKKLRKELKKPVALLLDTKGPEIRLKKFINNSVVLNDGDSFILTGNDIIGDETKVAVTYSSLPKEVTKGNKILIDDGKVELIVEETDDENIYCKVVHGGKISNHKGVNVPTVHLSMPYLSETDKKDILFGISQDVDFIAASFVRTKEDMINIRKFLDDNGGEKIRIIAKIENQEGIDNFEEILDLACGLMVARGDMGVEVDFEMLPGIQKRIITKCLERGRIVITATQMLDSMINNPSPTRAEISDVANAIFDGSSAIMLSGETANGKYPIETVKTMTRIALRAEKDAFEIGSYNNIDKMSKLIQEEINGGSLEEFIRNFVEEIIISKIDYDRYNIKLDIFLNLVGDIKPRIKGARHIEGFADDEILYLKNQICPSVEVLRADCKKNNFTYNVYVKTL